MVSAKIGHQPSLAELVRLEDPEFYLDPHPVYDRMRREQPVYYYPPLDIFVLTRYAEMREAARRPDLFSSAHGVVLSQLQYQRDGDHGPVHRSRGRDLRLHRSAAAPRTAQGADASLLAPGRDRDVGPDRRGVPAAGGGHITGRGHRRGRADRRAPAAHGRGPPGGLARPKTR